MELFHDVKIDWLGKKWYFLSFSLIFSIAGLISILFWHHIPLGIDFKGGTLVYVKFDQPPSADHIRDAVDRAGIRDSRIQPFGNQIGRGPSNQVIISLPEKEMQESNAEAGSDTIVRKVGMKRNTNTTHWPWRWKKSWSRSTSCHSTVSQRL